MAAINDNRNLGLSIANFHEVSNGTHNVGELVLENGAVKIVNNHVWKTGQNNTILSAEQNRAVREALYDALQNDIGNEGIGATFLEKARSILLGANSGNSLTREMVRQLYDAEQYVKGGDGLEEQHERMNEVNDRLDRNLKSLADRHITRPAEKGLMRSSRDAAFRLTVNERRDRLRELLARHYPEGSDARNARRAELETIFFGTDEASAELAEANPQMARYRMWLDNFDVKAKEANGGTVSDDVALKDLDKNLALDKVTHFVLKPERRKSEVERVLADLFNEKGGVGLATKDRLITLLFGDGEPDGEVEAKIAGFKSWVGGGQAAYEGDEPIPDDEVVVRLKAVLSQESEKINAISVDVRGASATRGLEEAFKDKGGVGQAMKVRLDAILSAPDMPGELTETEEEIAKFRGWVKNFNTAMLDASGKVMSDEEASVRLRELLKKVGDGIRPVRLEDRRAAVDSALASCDGKGGYGNAVKERLNAILSGSKALGELTDDEKKIARFGEWVNSFDKAMKDESGRVMSDEEASAQLQTLLKKVGDEIEPISQNVRKATVEKLLKDHFFSQGGVGQRDGRRLEMVFDRSVDLKDLSDDEQVFAGLRDWIEDFAAVARGKDGRALSDKAALDLLTAQLGKMGAAIKPMSVEERQDAAKRGLDELFAAKGDYGLAMKERLQAILLGEDEPAPSSYENNIERELGTNFRQWLHNFNVIAANPNAVADDPDQAERAGSQPVDEERVFEDLLEGIEKTPEKSMLSDQEGCRRLHELLAKAADGIAPMSLDDRKGAVEKLLQEKIFSKDGGQELGERLRAVLQGEAEPNGDTEIGIARFTGWLRDINTMARGENDRALSDESALERLDALLGTASQELLSPADRKKREVLDAIKGLLDNKEQLLDMFRKGYERTGDDLSREYETLNVAEARTLAWWQVKHQPDFEQVWSEAVDAGNKAVFGLAVIDADRMDEAERTFDNIPSEGWERMDVEEAMKWFEDAMTEVLKEPIGDLETAAKRVKGYSESDDLKGIESNLLKEGGELLDALGSTDGQKAQVLAEFPEELKRRVYLCNEDRGAGLNKDAEPTLTLYHLIEGGEKGTESVQNLFGEMKLWMQRRLAAMREKLVQDRIEGRLQVCLQEGRKEALRQIVKAMPAFGKMALTDEELEQSVGSVAALTVEGVSEDEAVRELLRVQNEALNAKVKDYVVKGAALPSELNRPVAESEVLRQLTENIAKALVAKFTGTANVGASTQIADFANKIRDARRAEFEGNDEMPKLADTLAQGVANRLVSHFEELLGGKSPDKGQLWLSSEGTPAKFDGGFLTELSKSIAEPIQSSMTRVYANRHAVTEKDVEQDCEYVFALTRNLLKGFGGLYRNLAVDKKNYVSNLKFLNRDVVVATEGGVATVRAVMRREALKVLKTVLSDLKGFLNDADDAKMKKAISDAAEKVVDDPSVRRLWHTHQDESRNVKVRAGLLEGLKG